MHATTADKSRNGLLIIPCYNEQEIITASLKMVTEYLSKARLPLDILVVDDGSTDRTRELANVFIPNQKREITVLSLDRNSGHQAAVLAGIDYSLALGYRYSISIDCDLQDDLELLPAMIMHGERHHIVAACHRKRKQDHLGKRLTANWFYSVANLLGIELLPHHADFRLLSARAAKSLMQLNHDSLFLRGAIMQLGFLVKPLSYERQSGLSNQRRSKYNIKKMTSLALNGILVNTVLPLRIVLLISMILTPLSLGFLAYLLCASWLGGHTVPGWLSLFVALLIGFSLISTCLGVIAEYIARLYKSRTRVMHYQIRDDEAGQPTKSS
jgi:glycosyltransferase involved in cell wall biosynthesis